MTPAQGDIWWAQLEEKRRPVLVVTRSEAIPILSRILVAPVTTSVRGVPTEIPLGPAPGLRDVSAAVFDDLRRARPRHLRSRIGRLDEAREQICRALAALSDC